MSGRVTADAITAIESHYCMHAQAAKFSARELIYSAVFKISKMLKISQITQTKEAQNWQNCVRSMTLKSIAILVATVRQMFVL